MGVPEQERRIAAKKAKRKQLPGAGRGPTRGTGEIAGVFGSDRGTLVTHPNPSLRNRRTRCGRGKSKDKERELTCPPPSAWRAHDPVDVVEVPATAFCWRCSGPRPSRSPSQPQAAAAPAALRSPPVAGQARASPGCAPRPRRAPGTEPAARRRARLAYPSGWQAIRSDPGTVTAALGLATGEIRGYLNATPRQGAETGELGQFPGRPQPR